MLAIQKINEQAVFGRRSSANVSGGRNAENVVDGVRVAGDVINRS